MYNRLDVKYPLFSSDLIELEFSGQIFEKFSNIILDGNRSIVPCGQRDERINMMKLRVAFRSFENTPEKDYGVI
jgi:hypothetical protein